MTPAIERSPVKVTLGQYLASVRNARKMTLREVEEASNKEVSNAYLSQIENDRIQKPSPNILYRLSDIYSVSYENLMEMAGYITVGKKPEERHGTVPTFSEMNLTDEEQAELLRFLNYIRSK